MNTAVFDKGVELQKLTGDDKMKSEGSWVFSSQGVAAEKGFKNVSKHWIETGTMSYEDGLKQLEDGKARTRDILATLGEMNPVVSVDGGGISVRYKDGQFFRPTIFAACQMGGWANCGKWLVKNLLTSPTNHKGEAQFTRDKLDAETLVHVLRNGYRRIDPNKKFLWRTRDDGTLRAMLSEQYATVDNRWYVEAMQKLLPGGRLSHWNGDSDTVYGNVLIPDTIRQDEDSDYGGMLSIGNSEIGERRVSSLPSIFRAICMNGCIWGAKLGKGIRQVHRGKINLDQLFLVIKENLEAQIPLLPQGIDMLLAKRDFVWEGQSMLPLFAQVANDSGLTKVQATGLLGEYNTERLVSPDNARSLFGVINSITRLGQKFDNAVWVRFDEIGGQLAAYDRDQWNSLAGRAKKLTKSEVEAVFALAV